MKYIKLINADNPDDILNYPVSIIGAPFSGATEWLLYQDFSDCTDYIADNMGSDVAFQAVWHIENLVPDDPYKIGTWNKIGQTLNYMKRLTTANSGPGENINNKMWYAAKAKPETRKYVQWGLQNNIIVFRVLDSDKSTVLQNWTITGPSYSISSVDYCSIFNYLGFLAAPSVGESEAFILNGSVFFEGDTGDHNPVPNCRAQIYPQARTYFDWLWWLSDGEDDTEDDEDEPNDPYQGGFGPSAPGGGGGTRPPYDEGDDIPFPDSPPISICDTGLITLYTPSITQLNLLAADIWSNNFVSSLVKDVYADPIDVIINVGLVPFNVTPAGTKKIKVGERELDITSNYPQSNYVDFDMGSVAINEALGAYTDFAPYTKGNIYIPFVGFCPLDVDYFMGHNIGLKYKVDLCTGSAVAYLMRDNSVHQQFACNLKIDVPLSSADYSGMWNTIISATAALAKAGMAGMAGATVAGEAASGFNEPKALKSGAQSASDIMTSMSTKPQIQKSNNMPGTGGLVGYPCAFIVLEHPALAIPTNQNKFIGYPSYINTRLNSLTGYTRVSSIHLGIQGATKSELLQIESTLKSGFRIEGGEQVTGNGIVLINNGSAENVIGKSMSLVASLTGAFRDEVDIVKPVVRIERASAVGFNYVYISDFGRYYYVEELKAFRNNILELSLTCDPLESFKAQILEHDAIIDKQENQWNLYLNDDSIKMYQYPLIWRKLFDNAFWDDFEFVLITAGH